MGSEKGRLVQVGPSHAVGTKNQVLSQVLIELGAGAGWWGRRMIREERRKGWCGVRYLSFFCLETSTVYGAYSCSKRPVFREYRSGEARLRGVPFNGSVEFSQGSPGMGPGMASRRRGTDVLGPATKCRHRSYSGKAWLLSPRTPTVGQLQIVARCWMLTDSGQDAVTGNTECGSSTALVGPPGEAGQSPMVPCLSFGWCIPSGLSVVLTAWRECRFVSW